MEDINSRVKELEAQLKRLNETVENTRSNLLEQINQINDTLETLKQRITPFQESSHVTMRTQSNSR
jgi:TolA-binding protein